MALLWASQLPDRSHLTTIKRVVITAIINKRQIKYMLILHLSDTHSKHHELHNLPPADIIIHSGDISFAGSENEVMDFIEWFGALPYKYKIFIAGNHDDCLFGANIDGLPQNCYYLCNSSVTIQGVKFYGTPMFMEDAMSGDYDRNIQKVPTDTNVLITHQPPYGFLDYSANINYGDSKLLQIVLKIKPKYHLFGHIHGAYGIEKSEHTTFVNSAILSENYQLMYDPILLKL
jgi:Icc-related predicted phosphoesterase